MPNQTPIPTQINIAPSGMTWKNWKLVQGTDGFPTRETMEKYLCNPDRVRDLEECRDLNHRTIKQLEALIQLYEAQMEAVGAGGVEPLRKCNKLHQIAEPAAPVGKPIEDAIDALVMAAFTEGGCSEHRMSEARIQTELRKKELRTLLSTPQPCSRSHPTQQGLDALDAARYRWLRERDLETVHKGGVFAGMTPENYVINGVDLDAAIDAAIAAQAKQGGASHD